MPVCMEEMYTFSNYMKTIILDDKSLYKLRIIQCIYFKYYLKFKFPLAANLGMNHISPVSKDCGSKMKLRKSIY